MGSPRNAARLEMARELGARHVINAATEDVTKKLLEYTNGRGADVIFELAATRETMKHAVAGVAKRGKILFIGYSFDSLEVHPIELVIKEASVMGSVGNTLEELHQALHLLSTGKIKTVVDSFGPKACRQMLKELNQTVVAINESPSEFPEKTEIVKDMMDILVQVAQRFKIDQPSLRTGSILYMAKE